MSINPVKPCSKCLRARQKAAELLMGKPKRRLVQTDTGDIVLNEDHTVAEVRPMPKVTGDWVSLVGRKTYIAGKKLIDVTDKQPAPLAHVGRIIKVSPID
jgi:hypothetical protein